VRYESNIQESQVQCKFEVKQVLANRNITSIQYSYWNLTQYCYMSQSTFMLGGYSNYEDTNYMYTARSPISASQITDSSYLVFKFYGHSPIINTETFQHFQINCSLHKYQLDVNSGSHDSADAKCGLLELLKKLHDNTIQKIISVRKNWRYHCTFEQLLLLQ
jgi:hypothetical protein